MKITMARFALLIVALLLISACAKKKDFSGEYRGEATALLEPNYPNAPQIASDKSADVVATIKQDGSNVTLEVSNSNILKGCKFTGMANPDGKAYVGRTKCDVNVKGIVRSIDFSGGSGPITIDDADGKVTIELTGTSFDERFTFKFQGKKK